MSIDRNREDRAARIAALRRELEPVLRRFDDAYCVGRPITAISAWRAAYDRIVEYLLPDLRLTLRWLLEGHEDGEACYREGLALCDELNRSIEGFTRPDELATAWTRAGGSEADREQLAQLGRVMRLVETLWRVTSTGDLAEARELVQGASRELTRLAPGTRGAGARSFARIFDMPAVDGIHTELTAIIERAKAAGLAPEDLAALGGVSDAYADPGPAEWACRYLAVRATLYYGDGGCSWQTVSSALQTYHRQPQPPLAE